MAKAVGRPRGKNISKTYRLWLTPEVHDWINKRGGATLLRELVVDAMAKNQKESSGQTS